MYAWRAPRKADMNQIAAAHLGPRVSTEPARPARRKPGLASPITKPSHQCIVFSSRRASTSISATLWAPICGSSIIACLLGQVERDLLGLRQRVGDPARQLPAGAGLLGSAERSHLVPVVGALVDVHRAVAQLFG